MTQQVRFIIREDTGTWWATSPDIPGYVLSFTSLEELRREIAFGLREVLEMPDAEVIEIFEEIGAQA